jgi:hypothetical protein
VAELLRLDMHAAKTRPTAANAPPANAPRASVALTGLLLLSFALAAGSAAQKSVTVDEYQALPHGLAILRTGDLHLATGVPVLPSVLAALPLLATSAPFDTATMPEYVSSWQCGAQFLRECVLRESGPEMLPGRYHDYFLLGRLVSIAVLLITCGLAYGYARSLYGPWGGLIAAALACLSPNLLAHGRLVTPDIYLAATMIGSLWAFDALACRAGWGRAIVLGLVLGLAALSKLTGLWLFILLPLVVAGWRLRGLSSRERTPSRGANGDAVVLWRHFGAAFFIGLLLINAAYGFQGSCAPLGANAFRSGLMQTIQRVLPGWLPVPLPRYFFQGIDEQLAERGYEAYLLGDVNQHGFFGYYVVGLLVKTPAPVLVLCLAAWRWGGRPRRRELPLVVVAAVLLTFFSLSRHKNIGMRYVLFLEPMMAVWVARLAACEAWHRPQRARWAVSVGAACLAAVSLLSWPHYLPYFNWLSGGPDHGHAYLLDSNLDWGQDLIALRDYMHRERIDEIGLAYYGRVPPEVYGIRYRPFVTAADLKSGAAGSGPRYVAISANFLWGLTYIANGDPSKWLPRADIYRAFRRRRPRAILGHSIYVFDLAERRGD